MANTRNPIPLFWGTDDEKDSFDITQWCRQIEISSECYEWDERKKIMMSLLLLRGVARKWMDTLENNYTWESFKSRALERFGERPAQIMEKLYSRTQLPNESVGTFSDDFLNLLARASASGNPIPGPLALTSFVDGLLPHLQDSLILKNPPDLSTAITDAKYFEFFSNRNGRSIRKPAVRFASRNAYERENYNVNSNGNKPPPPQDNSHVNVRDYPQPPNGRPFRSNNQNRNLSNARNSGPDNEQDSTWAALNPQPQHNLDSHHLPSHGVLPTPVVASPKVPS